jgi:hypothetical protein
MHNSSLSLIVFDVLTLQRMLPTRQRIESSCCPQGAFLFFSLHPISQLRFLAWDDVESKSNGSAMVGMVIFSIVFLTLLPFLNVVVTYLAISHGGVLVGLNRAASVMNESFECNDAAFELIVDTMLLEVP